jgi:hypothetical protein
MGISPVTGRDAIRDRVINVIGGVPVMNSAAERAAGFPAKIAEL